MKTLPRLTNLLSLIFLILLAGSLGSCHHYYYAPSDGHLMGLSEKGDVKMSGGLGRSNGGATDGNQERKRTNYNLQVGFSPIKNIGVQASFFSLSERDKKIKERLPYGFGSVAEGALGYYNIFNKKSAAYTKGMYWMWDAYAGYGKGNVENYYEVDGLSILDFRKYFFQGGIHFQAHKYLSVGFGLRAVFLDYQTADLFGRVPNDEAQSIQHIQGIEPINLLESSFRIQGGSRHFKVFFSTTLSNHLDGDNFSSTLGSFRYIGSIGNFGIIIEPDEFFRPKSKVKIE